MANPMVAAKFEASTDRYLALGVDDGTTEDADYRFEVDAAGKLEWGNGTDAPDTNLYRSAANTLKTDDNFEVTGTLTQTGIATFAAAPVFSAGYKDTYTAATTAAELTNNGMSYIANTTAGTFTLAAPTVGLTKRISAGTTITHTINGTSCEIGTTGAKGFTLAAKDASVTLYGKSTSQWLIVAQYSTAGGFALTTGA